MRTFYKICFIILGVLVNVYFWKTLDLHNTTVMFFVGNLLLNLVMVLYCQIRYKGYNFSRVDCYLSTQEKSVSYFKSWGYNIITSLVHSVVVSAFVYILFYILGWLYGIIV